jgi:homoserine kinase type II
MAVFTEVSFDEAARLVETLGLGRLAALQPCAGGIENTNYFADTDRGRYVLTVFERLSAEELPFYLRLMKHLADRGLPVPGPHPDARGDLVLSLHDKPAAVVDRLPGEHHLAPDAADCASVGTMLAGLHLAGADFPLVQPNLRGLDWWIATVPDVLPHLEPRLAALMRDELAWQRRLAETPAHRSLPRGAIHGDLFRDNVMFDAKVLAGVFDFYFAGVDCLLFDLAVALNDWCIDLESGRLAEDRAEAMVEAYESVRPLEGAEIRLLPALMRAAAFRFWLSRSWDVHLPREAKLLKAHDPTHFERVLLQRREAPWHPARHRAPEAAHGSPAP